MPVRIVKIGVMTAALMLRTILKTGSSGRPDTSARKMKKIECTTHIAEAKPLDKMSGPNDEGDPGRLRPEVGSMTTSANLVIVRSQDHDHKGREVVTQGVSQPTAPVSAPD